jgi:GNAT superfamily N-acetyltransferase
LHDLDWAVEQDVPSADPPRKKSTAEFIKERIDNPDLLADGWLVAVDGDRYVGLSRTWRSAGKATHLRGGLTGVRREYRRRGIATALKVYLIRFAQEYGARTMNTANDEENPMFTINLKLGFVPRPAWVEYEKALLAED